MHDSTNSPSECTVTSNAEKRAWSIYWQKDRQPEVLMRISGQLLAIAILFLSPFASKAQEVVPYAKSEVRVDCVRGTEFSKYKSYAWGTTRQTTPNPKHPTEDIDAALQAKGLQKVGMDANPSLIVAFSGKGELVYAIQTYHGIVKQGTLVVELADPQLKKAVWWGIANEAITDNPDEDVPRVHKKILEMFEKYPPRTGKCTVQ
jgi:hypothetical protein